MSSNNSKKISVKSVTPAKALQTPSDLKPESVLAVADALNPVIADAWALYLKTKNYHWHVTGSHFRDYHLLLDEQADSVLSAIDPLAERLRRIGATTIRSISHVTALQTIQDDNDDYVQPEKMIQNLIEDNKHLARAQRAAHHVTEEANDVATASLLEDVIDATEKRIWFLHSVTQGGQNVQ